jgi:ankyrin repeat protein
MAIMGRWDMIEVVMDMAGGVGVDTLDEYNNCLLHYLALFDRADIITQLLKTTGNILQRNVLGDDPMHVCVYSDGLSSLQSILSKYGREESHEEIILTRRTGEGLTIVHTSIVHGAIEIFKYCLKVIAKIENIDAISGRTVLQWVIDEGSVEMLEILMSRRGKAGDKDNPLFYAVKNKRPHMLRVLLKYFDKDYALGRNRQGQSLLDVALQSGDKLTLSLLQTELNLTNK